MAEDNGQADVQEIVADLEPEVMAEPNPNEVIRGIATVRVMQDGNFQVELFGLSQLEAPSLLRVAAKRVEKELGIA